MSPSTASTKSICLTLALVALARSSSAASPIATGSGDLCDTCFSARDGEVGSASFESVTIINRLPIYLPSLAPTTHTEDDHDTTAQHNASEYNSEDSHYDAAIEDEEEFELPEELADMIANAKKPQQGSSSLVAAPAFGAATTFEDEVRYYPTYSEDELCSSKSMVGFESWEESYASLADCCEIAFSWDYDACVGL